MPNQPGLSGAGEEAARKLLEGATSTTLEHDELLAGIEALASQKSVEAADTLARLDRAQAKDVAKAARRALFRLQTQGIRPSGEAHQAEPAPRIAGSRPRWGQLWRRCQSRQGAAVYPCRWRAPCGLDAAPGVRAARMDAPER